MGQSKSDGESLQDRQHRAESSPDGLDQHSFRYYSHDYPADTTLEYTLSGNRAELRLSFSSEDPDLGTEEMLYAGENSESIGELVSDLRADLTAWLDASDTSSFHEQQGISLPDGIHSQDDYFGEYSRTALYAFEAILRQTELETEQDLKWGRLSPDKQDWLFSADSQVDQERGCIGHLRGDFGSSGTEFWTTWFTHQPDLLTAGFREELQGVVDRLRAKGGLLSSFEQMRKQCQAGTSVDDSYGFHAESRNYEYCLRCIPVRGSYHLYLYCYDKNTQRDHAHRKEQHIPLREQLKRPVPQAKPREHKSREPER